ncbi:MAG: restriction endonuclease subunit S, partial [Thermoleophilia bacterium]
LYWPHLKRAFVLLPPLPIQKEIVQYIVKRCAKIDALISNINSEIALLVEYRTRLTSDVVTGQIDVRDIEVPEFEYIADEADDASDDENIDAEEMVEEEE